MEKEGCVITKKTEKGKMVVDLCKMMDECNCGSPDSCSRKKGDN